jgi:predicted nucleic acid-binding protein
VSNTILIDTSVLVALIDKEDKWHSKAMALEIALAERDYELLYLDCVFSEAISVIGRRAEEQRRGDEFDAILMALLERAPAQRLLWLMGEAERLIDPILSLIRSSSGQLGFNDALLALVCQELGVSLIASYDKDFDRIPWLRRITQADEF